MHCKKDMKTIDEIKKVRSRNNDLWMKLLKIAMSNDAKGTKAVLKKIGENDMKIYKLNEELAE